ncbi:hypothetical protein GF318_00345 [Candidatus Micrarchaeota archaeon]|nr:hypothetical protein [Candidatus Micrarchaeota archaeon]
MDRWAALKKLIRKSDVVVEVADARDIEGTRIPAAEKMAGTRKLVLVANKRDLLEEGNCPKVPKKGLLVSARERNEKERRVLINTILERTSSRPAKALFIGYPNVGKSTLINMLAGRKAAKASSIAGTTRNVQWIRINEDLKATDYRGIFPENEAKKELARKGAINVEKDAERYAFDFAEKILKRPELKKWAEKRFDIELGDAEDSEDVLNAIAVRRGMYLKGGELNLHEAAKSLVRAMMEAPEI